MTRPGYITKKEHAVLVLLAMRFEAFPLDMVDRSHDLDRDTIFDLLDNMVERELLTWRRHDESLSLAHRAYQITADGRAALHTARVGGYHWRTDA